MDRKIKPLRVLSLDGGGMRGIYAASYLARLTENFAKKNDIKSIDFGAKFDLIVGTSTGAFIACGLAAEVPLYQMVDLYREHGHLIFQLPVPDNVKAVASDVFGRSNAIQAGEKSLRDALTHSFGGETLGALYHRRRIALAIPSVEMGRHRGWVFKTSHLKNSNKRDDGYSLVDVCLASSAAPIYRSLAYLAIPESDAIGGNVFCDGGLWANNPVLVALLDALEMAEEGQEIQIFCMGTCPRPAGEEIKKEEVHRGLLGWRFGADVASLAIDAQEFAYHLIATKLTRYLTKPCSIIRFPTDNVPASMMQHLGLDDVRPESMAALARQAHSDADFTNSICGDENNPIGKKICGLFDCNM